MSADLPQPPPRLAFYHDGRHPLIYMYEPPIQRQQYEQGVDELLGTPVDALMFCLGDGRTVLHDTKVGELWGHNVERWPHLVFRRAHQNAQAMIDRGEDPLMVICERAQAKGLPIYPTLLVQQGSGVRGEDCRGSDFRFDNKALEIGAKVGVDENWPGHACLDFLHEEVRSERFHLIEETLQRYPVDGFELQLNYQPFYFHPDEVGDGREVMTAWVQRVSEALRNSGRGRRLTVRVPVGVQGCYDIGLDVASWMRQGLVDIVIGQTFSGPELVDCNADYRELVATAKGTGTHVMATLQSLVDSDRLGQGTPEVIRACACNYWDQGVDGLYLGHWFGNWPYEAEFYEKLRELPHPEVMAAKDKYYYVPTGTGRYPQPVLEPGARCPLPLAISDGESVSAPLVVSDDLAHWQEQGRVHEVILRLRLENVTESDELRFRLNGTELPVAALRRINEMYRMNAPRFRTGSCYWFLFRLTPPFWPIMGENEIDVELVHREPEAVPGMRLRDVELEIRYLMGKAYHRSLVDSDLGPTNVGVS
ncbi:MAG TPA: hypothetical protein DIC52_19500 [Candidatus Latescibacteria bacterium]|nr:hypothetical protein [Candidatus Latescibacterota bacterium]